MTYNKSKGYRIEIVEFYDRKNSLLKTLNFSDYNFGANLTEDDFSQAALQRAGK